MHQLAQLNIARMRTAYDDPRMQGFIDALDPMHQLSDRSPGFVWRLESDHNGEAALAEFEASGWLVNMSVWESVEALRAFVTSGFHLSIMRRRAEWFEKVPEETMVLWWVERGHRPSFSEAMERLQWLRDHGPSEKAFKFSQPYPAPGGG